MSKYQEAKRIVREYFDAMENATHENVAEVLKHTLLKTTCGAVFTHSVSKKALKLQLTYSGLR